MVVHAMADILHQFQGQKVKGQGHQPLNAGLMTLTFDCLTP